MMFDHIVTVTLNPSLDVTLWLDDCDWEEPNICRREKIYAGGKSPNVSRVLKNLGVPSKLLGLAGIENSKMLTGLLEKDDIDFCLIETAGAIRENMTLLFPDGRLLKINRQGAPITGDKISQLLKLLHQEFSDAEESLAVFAGSPPPNIGPEDYKQIILSVVREHIKIAVDTNLFFADDMKNISPFVIKPNRPEAKRMLGNADMSDAEMIREMKDLSAYVDHILLSCGGDGLLYFRAGACWKLTVPQVPVRSTIGAGDTTLAGFLAALVREEPPLEAARYAAACGTASVMLEGTEAIHPKDAEPLLEQIRTEKI